MIDDFPDQDLNDWITAYNNYKVEAFADAVLSAVVADLIAQAISGKLGVYTIIIVPDIPPHKYTVYYWKYTAYHINQPMHHIPYLIEETAESNG